VHPVRVDPAAITSTSPYTSQDDWIAFRLVTMAKPRQRESRWWEASLALSLLWLVTALPVHGTAIGLVESAIFAAFAFGGMYWRHRRLAR